MTASRGDRERRGDARRGPHDRDEYAEQPGDEEEEYEDAGYPDEEEEDARPRRRPSAGDGGLTAVDAAEEALRQITGMTGKDVEGVTSVRPTQDGWTVGVELLDARRIPSSSDTLALYEVEIYADGELKSYHRVARYSRARGEAS